MRRVTFDVRDGQRNAWGQFSQLGSCVILSQQRDLGRGLRDDIQNIDVPT
jgi:hypothetical protein